MKPSITLLFNGENNDFAFAGVAKPGETVHSAFELENSGEVDLFDITVSSSHPDLTIISYPTILKIGETKSLLLSYTPRVQLSKGLSENINIEARYLV
jgi:hypothetical protein